MTQGRLNPSALNLTPGALALHREISSGTMPLHKEASIAGCNVAVRQGADSLWILVSRPGRGGFALRTAYSPGPSLQVKTITDTARLSAFEVIGSIGTFNVRLEMPNSEDPFLRCTVTLTPAAALLLPSWPRDFYVLDAQGNPAMTEGVVHAAQRGLNSGIVYLSLNEPRFGSALYFQNLTALNDYFDVTETIPDGRVGGLWPELGYAPPTSETKPLPAGREITLSDVYLRWTDENPDTPQQSARCFLDLLAGVYTHLDRPDTEYHDWTECANRTLHDLQQSPKATVRHYRHTYLHPYTDAEYPDSMVQLTVLMPVREYAAWRRRTIPFADQLRSGVSRFFDPTLKTVRRYLPNVGNDKNPDAVDSWYLYHPLTNLARLASEGDEEARALFLDSLAFGMRVARHFKYQWPVQYDMRTLEVITGNRKPGDPGQSDVGGLYAYVMLQAYRLTGDDRYLREAKQAVQATRGMGFEIEYQANITGWGANACLGLFQITGEAEYLEQSYVFLSNFFHNCLIWESQIAFAKSYPNFLAVTCLHDGPYMALYECFESFAAFHEYLSDGQASLPDSVRLLLTEYCKYALTRAWYYYPANLPEEAIAKEIRNGHIDRALSIPLEDLYGDGQPAGQVGQEIYGSGAAFTFVTRSYHRLKNAPFLLYCEYPVFDLAETDDQCFTFRVRGVSGFSCRARLIPTRKTPMPDVSVRDVEGGAMRGHTTPEGHREFLVDAAQCVEVRWKHDRNTS